MGSFNLKPMTFEFQKKIPESAMGLNTQPQSPLTQGSYGNTYTNYQTKAMQNFNDKAQQTLNKADASVAAATGKPMNSDLSFKNEDFFENDEETEEKDNKYLFKIILIILFIILLAIISIYFIGYFGRTQVLFFFFGISIYKIKLCFRN